ncbi:MAG: hypothetical protein CME70_15005 [Halobacteriovorax sp.]|nr:hypothetical protein [Halobacteriovorax sp.]
MFVPNFPTFRQVTLATFLLFSLSSMAESELYDELSFLETASKDVEVFLPGEQQKVKTKKLVSEFSDSISTGQAGIQKNEVKTDSYIIKSKKKKRLRFRSR